MFSSNVLPINLTSSSIAITSITILVLGLTCALYVREVTPLRSIPGPFLASISRLWIFQKQRGYQRQQVDIDLHRKYGSIVRISPHEVMVSSPKSLRTVYGMLRSAQMPVFISFNLRGNIVMADGISLFYQEPGASFERVIGTQPPVTVDGLAQTNLTSYLR